MEFFHKVTRFPFMQTRRVWYGISLTLVIGSLLLVLLRGLNLGVDFTGGVVVEVNFRNAPNLDQLRTLVESSGFKGAQLNEFGGSKDILVRLPPALLGKGEVKGEQMGARIIEAFKSVDPGVELRRTEVVGPQVGQELFVGGGLALFATLILILIYVLFRFEFRLAVGATLAALHDPIIVVGFFAATQMTFDLTVVSAILAVIGYSLNDTVVVFDRLRERARAARKLGIREIIDESINQTLSRTVITSGTTLLVVVFLLLFGGEILRGFSTALIVGIVAGTYSSIYVAAALAMDIGLKPDQLLARKVGKPEEVDGLP
jgi:preprotein translocase subunit SecF